MASMTTRLMERRKRTKRFAHINIYKHSGVLSLDTHFILRTRFFDVLTTDVQSHQRYNNDDNYNNDSTGIHSRDDTNLLVAVLWRNVQQSSGTLRDHKLHQCQQRTAACQADHSLTSHHHRLHQPACIQTRSVEHCHYMRTSHGHQRGHTTLCPQELPRPPTHQENCTCMKARIQLNSRLLGSSLLATLPTTKRTKKNISAEFLATLSGVTIQQQSKMTYRTNTSPSLINQNVHICISHTADRITLKLNMHVTLTFLLL